MVKKILSVGLVFLGLVGCSVSPLSVEEQTTIIKNPAVQQEPNAELILISKSKSIIINTYNLNYKYAPTIDYQTTITNGTIKTKVFVGDSIKVQVLVDTAKYRDYFNMQANTIFKVWKQSTTITYDSAKKAIYLN